MASRNSDKPNILFILSDDQGAWAMVWQIYRSYYGWPEKLGHR